MRIRFMFYTLIVLTAVLTFSMPFGTLAQQNIVLTELDVRNTAELDAESDTNKCLWFGIGAVTFGVAAAVGAVVGCGVGSLLNPELDDYFGYFYTPNTEQGVGMLIGAAVIGISAPVVVSLRYDANPSSQRLLGKPPEYIEAYIDSYQKKSRSIRTKYAIFGVGAGLLVTISGCFLSVQD